jgi:murein L,D-transpeptidase YafK
MNKECLLRWIPVFLLFGTLHANAGNDDPIKPKPSLKPIGNVYIVIDKSDYVLNVFDEQGWFASYPVVFGSKDLSDKKMEGDRRTPEGSFKIVSKRPHRKWNKMMMLNYPTKESKEKFNQRIKNGEIPPNAKIGGGIAIHGTWPHDDQVIDNYNNWTMGCVSLKNKDMNELYRYLKVGTKVIIQY